MDLTLFTAGVLMVFTGFAVLLASLITSGERRETERDVRGGGVVIVGPIPIVFGSDKRSAYVAAAIGALLTLLALAATLIYWGGIRP